MGCYHYTSSKTDLLKKAKNWFQISAILSTFIKLLFVIKNFVLSIFEWLLKTGFTEVLKAHKLHRVGF